MHWGWGQLEPQVPVSMSLTRAEAGGTLRRRFIEKPVQADFSFWADSHRICCLVFLTHIWYSMHNAVMDLPASFYISVLARTMLCFSVFLAVIIVRAQTGSDGRSCCVYIRSWLRLCDFLCSVYFWLVIFLWTLVYSGHLKLRDSCHTYYY